MLLTVGWRQVRRSQLHLTREVKTVWGKRHGLELQRWLLDTLEHLGAVQSSPKQFWRRSKSASVGGSFSVGLRAILQQSFANPEGNHGTLETSASMMMQTATARAEGRE
jgi:hypothetical protein